MNASLGGVGVNLGYGARAEGEGGVMGATHRRIIASKSPPRKKVRGAV